MANKKPWRTVIVAGDTGRFTWGQIEAAVQKVKRERELKGARKKSGGLSKQASMPAERPHETRNAA